MVPEASYRVKYRTAMWLVKRLVAIVEANPQILAEEREVLEEAKFRLITESEEMQGFIGGRDDPR